MRWLILLMLTAMLQPLTARAEGEQAGDFDYYVLSLSWSPNFCAAEAENDHPQCDRALGWVLHGLWPQYEDGWPSYCRTSARNPSRRESDTMADIMGSGGSAWYQWKKHGRCTGLDPADYFALARLAYDAVVRPPVLRKLDRSVTLPASLIEEAFLTSNPGWTPDMLTITCKTGRIQEARLCLTRDLQPRVCGTDVVRDCTMQNALLDPIR